MFDLKDYLHSTKEVWSSYLPWTDYSLAVAVAVVVIVAVVLYTMASKYKIEPHIAAIGVVATFVLALGAGLSVSSIGKQKAEAEIQVLTEHTAQDLREWAAERYEVILSEEQAKKILETYTENPYYRAYEMSGVVLTGSNQPVQWTILEGNKLLLTEPSSVDAIQELPVISETVEISHEGHNHDHSHSHDEESHDH